MKIARHTTVPTETLTELVDGLDYCLALITNSETFEVKRMRFEDRDYLNQLIDLVHQIKKELKEEPKGSRPMTLLRGFPIERQ